MANNIFLAPRSNEQSRIHFKATIDDGIPYERIKEDLDDEGKEILSKQKKICAWGCGEGTIPSWNQLQKGDIVLFYIKGFLKYSGKVIYKKYSSELADEMWGRSKDGLSWSGTFFVDSDSIKEINIPIRALNKLAGYKPKSIVRKFQKLSLEGHKNIHDKFGSIESFLNHKFEEEDWPDVSFEKEINLKDIIDKVISDKETNYETHFMSSPKKIEIVNLISKVENEWALPRFQRYFDWKIKDIRSLLESIFNDYFVGSFLLWSVDSEPEVAFSSLEGVNTKIEKPRNIILDGQQRMTSIYFALNETKLKRKPMMGYFYIDFKSYFSDKSKDIIIHKKERYGLKESAKQLLFPLFKLKDYTGWLRYFQDYAKEKEIEEYNITKFYRIMEDKLRHFYEKFEIPYIELPKTMGLSHVIDIFENINTKGKQLDAFDLLIATSLKYKIELKELWEKTQKDHENIKRYTSKSTNKKIRLYVVQAISLCKNPISSCKRRDLVDIYHLVYGIDKNSKDSNEDVKKASKFQEDWKEMASYIHKAIDKLENLKDGFGVINEKHVPYMPTIPILAALLKSVEGGGKDIIECNHKIQQWYWSAVFNEAYGSAADSQLTTDYKAMLEWFKDDSKIPKTVSEARRNMVTLDLKNIFSAANARYKGVLSLLALNGAKDLETGESVASNRAKYDKDHLFPKSKFKNYSTNERGINSILNMTWLTSGTNQNSKTAKDPSIYFSKFAKSVAGRPGTFDEILSSHYIDKPIREFLMSDNFKGFIESREKIILNKIKKLIGWTYKDAVTTEETKTIKELLSEGEGEKLEFKSTFKKDIETGKSEKYIKDFVLKTVAGFLNKSGGKLIIGYNEKEKKVSGIEEDFEFCKHKDKDSFELELRSYLDKLRLPVDQANKIKISYEIVDGKTLAILDVSREDKAVYLDNIFYLRKGNRTVPIEDKIELAKYIKDHFN